MPRLVDEVVARLRDSIVEGVLPAGTRLPQVALAEQLGVSRTPLREALRVLESEGIVRTSDNNRSVEVVVITTDDLRDMYQFREVIDGLAARLAATHGFTSAEAERVAELPRQMAESTESYDPVLRSRAHSEFHELIANASRNTQVQSFVPLIRTSTAALYMPRIGEHAAGPAKPYQDILDEAQIQHQEIIDAILARDREGAEAATRRHIQRFLRLIPNFG